MSRPLVSVITPTFNRAHIITETLDSLSAQTFQDWEAIVIDDGSSDHTDEIFQKYSEKDARFRYHKRPDTIVKGANACRNYGVSLSKGKFLLFLDSDDILSPECLANRVAHMQETQADFLIFSMGLLKKGIAKPYVYPDLSSKTREEITKLFLTGPLPWNMTRPIWKQEFFSKHVGFNENMGLFDDDEFNIRVANDPDAKFRFVDETDCYYRIYKANRDKTKEDAFVRKIISSHLILLQTYAAIFDDTQKKTYADALRANLVKVMYGELRHDFSHRKLFLKNVFYFFRHFRTKLSFRILVLGALAFQAYGEKRKGGYNITSYFKNKLGYGN